MNYSDVHVLKINISIKKTFFVCRSNILPFDYFKLISSKKCCHWQFISNSHQSYSRIEFGCSESSIALTMFDFFPTLQSLLWCKFPCRYLFIYRPPWEIYSFFPRKEQKQIVMTCIWCNRQEIAVFCPPSKNTLKVAAAYRLPWNSRQCRPRLKILLNMQSDGATGAVVPLYFIDHRGGKGWHFFAFFFFLWEKKQLERVYW